MSVFSRGYLQVLSYHSIRPSFAQLKCHQHHSSPQRINAVLRLVCREFHQSLQTESLVTTRQTSPNLSTANVRNVIVGRASRNSTTPAKTLKPKPTRRPPPIFQQRSNTQNDQSILYRRVFATGDAPVLLYRSTAGTFFKLSCFALSGVCIGLGGWLFYDLVLSAPPGLWWPIPLIFGVTSAVAAGLGVWVGRSGTRHLQSIHAIPKQLEQSRSILLRMEVKSAFPFWPRKIFDRAPNEVSMGRRIANVNKSPFVKQADASRRAWDSDRNPLLRYCSRMFWGEGFANVWTEASDTKDPWKVDMINGYWGEEGQAIDRLVKLRDDPETNREDTLAIQRMSGP